MFTGIVEEIGRVREVGPDGGGDGGGDSGDGFGLRIEASTVLDGTALGDSIAVNGVCLTVTELDGDAFLTGLAPETLSRTNLGTLAPGSRVNLERSVTPSTRMGGHFVQGHVDAVGRVIERRPDSDALWVTIETPPELMRYIVTKGYVTIDGTSLTVVNTAEDRFDITLVAYTQAHVVLPERAIGDAVNLEVDVLGKYVERLLQAGVVPAAAPSMERAS